MACFLSSRLFILVSLVWLQAAVAGESFPAAGTHKRLMEGEVLFEIVDRDKPGGAAKVTALMLADKESIWNIIGYCRHALIYVRGLQHCEMLQADGRYMVQHHRLRHSWYAPSLDFIFEARREVNEYGDARLLSGNLRVFEASWTLTPVSDGKGVTVVHEFRIQPNLPAPKWLIRRNLKKDLPDMLACIRGLADASLTADGRRSDLDRCPGEVSK